MTTAYNAATPGQGPAAEVLAARRTCRELLAILIEENQGIARHDVKLIDEKLTHKRRLTLRLEQMLAEMKQKGSLWKDDPAARQQVVLLGEELAEFQTLARQNAMLLKAAHQLRADLVMAIRDTVDAQAPRVQTYGANGVLNTGSGGTRLLATSI